LPFVSTEFDTTNALFFETHVRKCYLNHSHFYGTEWYQCQLSENHLMKAQFKKITINPQSQIS